jgi:hypothetical protein
MSCTTLAMSSDSETVSWIASPSFWIKLRKRLFNGQPRFRPPPGEHTFPLPYL